MEYYLGILNRTYQIFVSPNLIVGAFVNNALPAPARLPKYWFDPKTYVNQKMSGKYNELTPWDEFKKISPRSNFQYQRSHIDHFSYDPTLKWGMGNVAHSGKLHMKLKVWKKA